MGNNSLTREDVQAHSTKETGLYLIIDGAVYSLADFLNDHPGGAKILQRFGGKDATKQFWKYHNESVLQKYGPRFLVGSLKEEGAKANL